MSRSTRWNFLLTTATLALSVALPASAALKSQGESKVVFKAAGPAGLSFEGKGKEVSLKELGAAVVVTVKLGSIETGIALRDRHMKEKYLETGKYPDAVLEVEKSKLQFPSGSAVHATVDGKLTLHGVTHPVKVDYHAEGNAKHANVDGTLRINMKDYKVEVPSYLGVTVRPNVDIEVKLAVVDQ